MKTSSTQHLAGGAPAVRPVVVFGQISVDAVFTLNRSLSSALGDQLQGRYLRTLGGTGAIVSYNHAALGGAPLFVGHVGNDAEDATALRQLQQAGVRTALAVVPGPGLRVTVLVDPDGQRTMISSSVQPDWSLINVHFPAHAITYFEGWHLFGPGIDPDHPYCALLRQASAHRATVVLDVCSASRAPNAEAHRRLLCDLPIDVLIANEREAEHYGLLASPVAPTTIVHRGPATTVVVSKLRRSEVPLAAVDPVDTTGAGDTFAAGFLLGLSRGEPIRNAINRAHVAAARVVTQPGALLPHPIAIPVAMTSQTKGGDHVRTLAIAS